MKKTQAYAKRSNVPVDNLVTFSVSFCFPGGFQKEGRNRCGCVDPTYICVGGM